MKTCPICKARCFDDMEVCFGCMHRFEPDQGSSSHEAEPSRIPPLEEIVWKPRHAAAKSIFDPNAQSNQAAPATQFVLPVLEEGKLQAEYQLVISLKPV